MDPEDIPDLLSKLHTTPDSRVYVVRLDHGIGAFHETAALNDTGLKKELQSLEHAVPQKCHDQSKSRPVTGRFTLFCTAGDAAYKSKPLQLTRTSLTNLLEKCSFPSYTLITFGFKRFHLTHHVQYDGNKDGGDPIAMVLLLRIARNSQSISIAMRICLADLSTTVFVTSMSEETGRVIREKCIERRCLLAKHPLYFLALIYEVRCADYKAWFDDILEEINVVESATGMTRNTWKMQLSPKLWDWFSDYDNLLKQLYSSHTELSHFDTVTVFSIKFGDFLLDALDLLRGLPAEVGFEPMTTKEARELRERIKFTRSRCDLTLDKTKEMLERVRGQINVAFNLVAQRDSKINLAVAEDSNHTANLAARDSETMKTITVLTLLFLPSSLVTSIWSAGLFQLDSSQNWKVYIAVIVSLTVTVFSLWLLYLRISGTKRKEKPLHISGIGYVREGKVVGAGPQGRDGSFVDLKRETNWGDK